MKKGFIISMLATAVVLTGCNAPKEEAKDYIKKAAFDFTPAEIVDTLRVEEIEFTPMAVVDSKEKDEKIAAYSSLTDVFNTDKENIGAMIHYQFTYDDTTYKVSRIHFFFDRYSTLATFRYLYHIKSIANYIDPNTNWDDISATIDKGFNDYDFAIYEGENFEIYASRSDEILSVSFAPNENTKGE